MQLTDKQQKGLEIALQRYKEHKKYTVIAGMAGTGKTTLVSYIIQALGIPSSQVVYVSFTGKAALVLREHGNENAVTAHKLLYHARQLKDGSYRFYPRKKLEKPYKIVVVDEVSMLPLDMWELLLSHPVHVLALGDPAQLPPVRKENNVLDDPHIFLDEIVRQAQDSEIIDLSLRIREGKNLPEQKGTEVQVLSKSKLVSGMLTWADQVLVATNKQRDYYNNLIRQYIWGANVPKELQLGDKIICLKNIWNSSNMIGESMVNGTIGTVEYLSELHLDDGRVLYCIDLMPEGYDSYYAMFECVYIDKQLFLTGVPAFTPEEIKGAPYPIVPFAYGYAITCHKAQGSQWDNVLVIEENFPFKKDDHKRWLYTACTRAVEKLVVIKN